MNLDKIDLIFQQYRIFRAKPNICKFRTKFVFLLKRKQMGKSCRDMAVALRDCMEQEECMADGSRTLKECLRIKEFSHECRVRAARRLRVLVLQVNMLTRRLHSLVCECIDVRRATAKRTLSADVGSWTCARASAVRRAD